MLVQALTELLGTLPSGFEPLLWFVAALFLLYLVSSTFAVLWSVVSWIGGK